MKITDFNRTIFAGQNSAFKLEFKITLDSYIIESKNPNVVNYTASVSVCDPENEDKAIPIGISPFKVGWKLIDASTEKNALAVGQFFFSMIKRGIFDEIVHRVGRIEPQWEE